MLYFKWGIAKTVNHDRIEYKYASLGGLKKGAK